MLSGLFICINLLGYGLLLGGDSERHILSFQSQDSSIESKYGCDLQWLQARERSRWRNERRAHRREQPARRRQARLERNRQAAYRRYHGLKGLNERSLYETSKGDVILDASYFRDVDSNEFSVTCTSCHETVKLCDMFKHYNDTAHRFFYNIQESACQKP